MLNGFGFEWIDVCVSLPHLSLLANVQIPGSREAEATLAAMTAIGIPLRIDAILTDDSDSFVFGASVVLRMCVFTIFY
jgi:hypothetical protein